MKNQLFLAGETSSGRKVRSLVLGHPSLVEKARAACLILLLMTMPAPVWAQFGYQTNVNNTNTVTITNYAGPGGDVAIPGVINGLTVTGIGVGAFYDCTSLTSAEIPDGVASLGEGAFDSCFNLTSVTIPGSVTNIGDYAFAACINLSDAEVAGGVAGIGQDAFENCFKLGTFTIPDSVTNIGDYAFDNCNGLTSIAIPSGVSSIGVGPFAGCFRLTAINVDPQNAFYSSTNGVLFNKAQATLVQYPGGVAGAYSIPHGIACIGDYAFDFCYSLSSITIPGSVTNIGSNAFFNCSSLASVMISNGVKNIGADAFFDCPLITLTLPASITNLGEDAFQGCTVLTNVFFRGDAPSADASVFVSDNDATAYYLAGTQGWSNMFAGLPAVLWNPVIQASGADFGVKQGQFGFDVIGTANIPIVVQSSPSLPGSQWVPLTNVALTNGFFQFSEPVQADPPPRYYRISSP